MDFYRAIYIYFYCLSFLLGTVAGSFVTCAADRYVAKEPIFKGRSHCSSCGHPLGILDLFPILSFLFLRGRCRHCGAKIPARCLCVEILGGLLFLVFALKEGISLKFARDILFVSALLAISLIDFDTMEIPDGLLVFGYALFVLFLPFLPNFGKAEIDGLWGALGLGGGMLVLALLMDFVLKRDSMGGGDIKLYALLGLYLGPIVGLLLVVLSCLIGLVFALLLKKKKEFPFGPAISVAAVVCLLYGQEIVNFYMALFL